MGVRLHKFLGYGIDDLQTDGFGNICDPRLNLDSLVLGERDDLDDIALDAYQAYLEKDTTVDSYLDRSALLDRPDDLDKYLDQCWAYNPEYGLDNVIVFRPLSCTDWHRANDHIDVAMENILGHTAEIANRVDRLRSGLYPFINYIHVETGERLASWELIGWLRARNLYESDQIELDMLAQEAGFTDHAEAEMKVVPEVPGEIINLVNFLNFFKEEDGWLDLRPMLYTYHS